MSEDARTTNKLLVISIVLVGLNTVGVFLLSAGVSRMSSLLGARALAGTGEEVPASSSRVSASSAGLPSAPILADGSPSSGLKVPGISLPQLCPPEHVNLSEAAAVIGIEINGESRAYTVEAFMAPNVDTPDDLSVHVVNDVVGEAAIAVTHCDVTHSTRVLARPITDSNLGAPLDVCIGGFRRGMLLNVNDSEYSQHAEDLPLDDIPYLTTTWGDWLEQHPDTLVYTGNPCKS